MCLTITGKASPQIATKNIRVWKVLTHDMRPKAFPHCAINQYIPGTSYSQEKVNIFYYKAGDYSEIRAAFHSYANKFRASFNCYNTNRLVEFVIPKGASYCKEGNYYASDKIKCVRRLRKFLWWHI